MNEECRDCVDQDVKHCVMLEVADLLQATLQEVGHSLAPDQISQLAEHTVSLVVSRISIETQQMYGRVFGTDSAAHYESSEHARLFLEAFTPQLSRIASEHNYPAKQTETYAVRRIKGQYAYAPRPVMAEVDQLITDNPPGGEWEERIGLVRVRVVLPSTESVTAYLVWSGSDWRDGSRVELTAVDDGHQSIHEGVTKVRAGQVIVISSWDREAGEQHRAEVKQWSKLPKDTRPEFPPEGPPSQTIAYVRAHDGRLVYVGDRQGEDHFHFAYWQGEQTLAKFIGTAEAREGNEAGHPLYEHSIEPVT